MDSRYIQQFKKGSLEMILLCLIAKKETYGYELLTLPEPTGRRNLGLRQGGHHLPHSLPAPGGKDW